MLPEHLFALLGESLPSPSCVDIHGRCTDPRYPFLIWNKEKNRWENRFFGQYYYFNNFLYKTVI